MTEGKVTWTPQSSAIVINTPLASAQPPCSLHCFNSIELTLVEDLKETAYRQTPGETKLYPYHAKAKASSSGEILLLTAQQLPLTVVESHTPRLGSHATS